jgi:hypothetical protein
MNKQELVGRLLLEGKITNEEAITLLSTQEHEQELTMIVNPTEIKLDKLLDKEFIDELFDYDPERIECITEFMDMANWTWMGEKVTPQMFRDTVIDHIKRALMQLIEDYRVHNVPKHEIHSYVDGGGIRVDCNINEGQEIDVEEDKVNIEVRFTAGTWFQDIKLKDILS